MMRAISLALQGWGRVAPNPLVGAVLLENGEIVGEGYHREFGAPHAEVAALDSCESAAGATCVINLEPCCHQGKTSPCTDALEAAGVKRVVFAVQDPDPAAAGGAQRLRNAGIEVASGVCAAEAAALNAPFLLSRTRPDLPYVALKLATSLDGFISDDNRKSRWISGEVARNYVHWLRAGFDGLGVGRRTVEEDDPQLTVRGDIAPRVAPTRVVFSRSGRLSPLSRIAQTAGTTPTILVTEPGKTRASEADLEGTEVEVLAASGIDEALGALRAKGIESILIEGGGMLAREFLDARVVDRLYWIQAPILLGSGVPGLGPAHPTALDRVMGWVPTERRSLGRDTLLVVDRELCLPES